MRRRFAADQFDALPLGVDNYDKRFALPCKKSGGSIVWDCDAPTAAGYCRSIRRYGFAAVMEIHAFRKLHLPLGRAPDQERLDYIRVDYPWGPPFLEVDIKTAEVRAHEGRHRAILAEERCGYTAPILVDLIPRDGRYRLDARDLDDAIIRKLNEGLYNETVSYKDYMKDYGPDNILVSHHWVRGPLFLRAFHQDREVDLSYPYPRHGLGSMFGLR